MANDLQVLENQAVGKPLTVPTSVRLALIGDDWQTVTALRQARDHLDQVPALAAQAEAMCKPADRAKLVQRLTALGMVMSPNRPPAEATMWVRETARLLADLADDVAFEAIDECQKKLRFLPTTAEIREVADPVMERRRREFRRLDAMRRYLESGQPLPTPALPAPRHVMERRGETMTEIETAELNTILENLGACSRYRPDGSRYEVSKRSPKMICHERPQMPTRQDYIDMGVDPDVLDKIAAEKAA